ncbi:hypothetical protein B0H13DRAFT_1866369 [Mycena leptocephala]|nr:hypothetical protein B0H13DRAFT_1866369 [Mycena leptocephala]
MLPGVDGPRLSSFRSVATGTKCEVSYLIQRKSSGRPWGSRKKREKCPDAGIVLFWSLRIAPGSDWEPRRIDGRSLPSGFKLLGCYIDHHNELEVPTIVQGLGNKGTEVTEVVLVTEISGTE